MWKYGLPLFFWLSIKYKPSEDWERSMDDAVLWQQEREENLSVLFNTRRLQDSAIDDFVL
jgi:hypothetical protein